MHTAKYTWVLFDADGTLFDFEKAEIAALESTLAQFGAHASPEHLPVYRDINKQLWRDLEKGRITPEALRTRRFELFFEAIGAHYDPADFSDRYLGNLAGGVELVDGATETVRALHGKAGMLVITNGLREVQRSRLAKSTLRDYFSGIVISEEVGVAKPHARIFDVAFERMGGPRKGDVLIVGDSLTSDIAGGNDYGIDTCWFNPSARSREVAVESTYEIRRLAELVEIVAGT